MDSPFDYFRPGTVVGIHRNDETGEVLFSLYPEGDFECWITSFYTREAALEYCQRYGFKHQTYLDRDTVRTWAA